MYIKKCIKSYIAGIMDGEGSIGFQRTKDNKGNNHIYPRVYVCNTHKPLLLFIKKLYNGNFHIQSASSSKKMKKELYRLSFNLKDMTKILKDIKPFLLIKRKQANLCLEFINTTRKIKRNKFGQIIKLDNKIVKFRKNLFNKYQVAQKEGKKLYKGRTVTKW